MTSHALLLYIYLNILRHRAKICFHTKHNTNKILNLLIPRKNVQKYKNLTFYTYINMIVSFKQITIKQAFKFFT